MSNKSTGSGGVEQRVGDRSRSLAGTGLRIE
jgi:hypothetical protein